MGKKAVEYPAECYVALLMRSTESTNSVGGEADEHG